MSLISAPFTLSVVNLEKIQFFPLTETNLSQTLHCFSRRKTYFSYLDFLEVKFLTLSIEFLKWGKSRRN